MYSGDHKNLVITVLDGNGASVLLTNASVSWMLAETPAGASLVSRTSDSGITVSGCTFTVSLSPVHTASLGGVYYHEAQVRDSASQISTVTTGNVTIYKDVIIT